ncbi:hypothetical protein C8Q79DRAFT_904557 [Trametes meyenii]|nr:hypothetical protein C8Q79DRAFT_904557 [Trametes meyenii]
MGTPHAVSECVVGPRDIERSPHGGGHAVQLSASEWRPTWTLFPLRAFRGREYRIVDVKNTWDDEQLLLALNDAYKELRVWYKRWFSLMGLRWVNDAFIYPQRVGPGRTTAHRNLRMRYLLAHPNHMRGKREFVRALTESAEFGIEFVERWRMRHVVTVVIGSALLSLAIALTYATRTSDWATGFTIASFFSQTFAEVFVLLGCLQYYEF